MKESYTDQLLNLIPSTIEAWEAKRERELEKKAESEKEYE